MESETPGLIGGISGACIGIAGSAIGIYFSLKNTNGPKEKSFMLRFGVIISVCFVSLIILLFIVPEGYKIFVWGPYLLLLFIAIRYGNKRLQEIRAEEENA
jgi:uncharacterized membrane protein